MSPCPPSGPARKSSGRYPAAVTLLVIVMLAVPTTVVALNERVATVGSLLVNVTVTGAGEATGT